MSGGGEQRGWTGVLMGDVFPPPPLIPLTNDFAREVVTVETAVMCHEGAAGPPSAWPILWVGAEMVP